MPKHLQHHHHRRQVDFGSNIDGEISSINNGVEKFVSDVATLVSVVYFTAAPTFDGPVGGYTTIGEVPTSAQAPPVHSSALPSTSLAAAAQATAAEISSALEQTFGASSTQAGTGSVSAPAPTASSNTMVTSPTSLLKSVSVTSMSSSPTETSSTSEFFPSSASVAATSATNGADPATISQNSSGLSGGAKAGIAIVVFLIVAGLLGVLGFCYRRRKNQKDETNSEKNPFGDNAAVIAPEPVATRVSLPSQLNLSPNTGFYPQHEMSGVLDHANGSELAQAQVQVDHPANPFGQKAEVLRPNEQIPAPLRIRGPGFDDAAKAGLVAGTAAATIAQRHNAPQPLDIKRTVSPGPSFVPGAMPSPAGTEFSQTSMSSGAIAGGATPTNVHRIQLDFKPSMEDEIELKAGQLVRLMHEYDDGWALCIRLDRSQQGVAPRTCLSARPVKPRSKPPGGISGGPRGPPLGPPMSPAGRPRSMSPGPYGGGPQQSHNSSPANRGRSNSAIDTRARRPGPPGPPGPSPMNPAVQTTTQGVPATTASPILPPSSSGGMARKPVPGRTM